MVSTFFLGACSPGGFVSHYDSLLEEGIPLTILKGGSGCGKSTFMRAVGQAAQERGMDVTYILCSSDPDSLDGVLIPQVPMAFVDGTSPHALEPGLCGGKVNYLNFGCFYDRAAMMDNEDAILRVQKENKRQYESVTACLRSADAMEEIMIRETGSEAVTAEMEAIGACLALPLEAKEGEPGERQRRFLSAVTPRGLRFCTQTPGALCRQVYVLRDDYCLGRSVLAQVEEKALELGHSVISCYGSLRPAGVPAHVLIPTAGMAVVTESEDFIYTGPNFARINLNSAVPDRTQQMIKFYRQERSILLRRGVWHMSRAKALHDRIEELCRPFVDFQGVTDMTEKTVRNLFS